MDAGAQMQALMQIIGSTPQAMEIQRQLAAGAGPFSLQNIQVCKAVLGDSIAQPRMYRLGIFNLPVRREASSQVI